MHELWKLKQHIYAGICACTVLQALKLSQSLFHSLNVLHIKQSISLSFARDFKWTPVH